jgi:hypothetical protein
MSLRDYYYTNLLGADFLRNENPNSANAELSFDSCKEQRVLSEGKN